MLASTTSNQPITNDIDISLVVTFAAAFSDNDKITKTTTTEMNKIVTKWKMQQW